MGGERGKGLNVKPAPQIEDLVNSADQKLFSKILSLSNHVLHSLLPPVKQTAHNLRRRTHNRILPTKTVSSPLNVIFLLECSIPRLLLVYYRA